MIEGLLSSLRTDPPNAPVSGECRSVVLGWVRNRAMLPAEFDPWIAESGRDCLIWDFGPDGALFLLNSHSDTVRTDEAIAIKLGFTHSESFTSLGTSDLLRQGIVGPRGVDHRAIRGNVLILCVSQRDPAFCIYQGLTSTSQAFYWRNDDWMICTDTLRHLVAMVEPLELNPDAVPQHLIYRTVPGEMTYFQSVYKLLCGQQARFWRGDWRLEQAERLDDWVPERQTQVVTAQTVSDFDERSEQLVGSYVQQIKECGDRPAVLLSGGVDSSLIASLVKSRLPPGDRLRSISYIMQVPSFREEVRYVQSALDLLGSEHQFYEIQPDAYPRLVQDSIGLLAQPLDNEQDPCYLLLARALSPQANRYLFSGSDPDCLLGKPSAKRLLQIETLRHMPGARSALRFSAGLLSRAFPHKAYGMRDAARLLQDINDPLSPLHPVNLRGMTTNLSVVQSSFDARTIHQVMQYRYDVFARYTSSASILEAVHLNSLTHDVHDEENALVQFLRAYGFEMVTPYLDSDFVRSTLAFAPRIRYCRNGQVKWLPKQMLDNRLHAPTTRWPKLSGGFDNELFQWMKDGVLREMVEGIDRPGYLSVRDFERLRQDPDWLTWNLLNLDLFQKRFVKSM